MIIRYNENQLGFDFTFPPERPTAHLSVDEIYNEMDQQMAVDAEEDHRIERKSARYSARPLGDYFSMWANTAPDGGLIVIGIENDGELTGCGSLTKDQLDNLQRCGDIYCPDARYACKSIPIQNSKGQADQLLILRVLYREDRVVETITKKAFFRRGSTKRELDEGEKRELQLSKGQIEIESEIANVAFPEDFNLALVDQFAANVREQRNLSFDHTREEILQLRRLGKIKNGVFQANLACALLFSSDPQLVVPGCKIKFVRFDGTIEKTGKDYNATKTIWIEGSVPLLIQEAEEILASQLREFMRLGDDGKFVSTPEYPKDAWYEAIVNACVHRSYNLKSMHITIKMFDDRLEVESPGGFLPLVTPKNIYEMHVPRNPHLMDAMFYLKFVLCAHEGTRRIRDAMKSVGLPAPVFQETTSTSSGVKITLKNDVEHRREFVDSDVYDVLGDDISQDLTDHERRFVNHIAEYGTINVSEAMRLAGLRWQRAKKILIGLVTKNVLDHVHSKAVERDAYAYFTLKKRFSDRLRSNRPRR